MQTVTHHVVTEVIANTGLSWPKAVAWCDDNLLPAWRTGLPVVAGIAEVEDGESKNE